ncbi:peroxidase-related enzyme [Salaquimonas pukyongi]|uniref:peroxidase-related enzyme n=1 Tax=Salaquimonas pukyongi TaxID=2712698 RepID=UPI00096BCE36
MASERKTKPIVALKMPKAELPLTDRQKKYLAVAQEKLGFVPNVLQAYAWHSQKFAAFTEMYNDLMLGDSGLTKLEREMIAVTVSSANHCYYCLTAHGAAVRQLSGDPKLGEQLVMNYRTAELTEKQRAMLDFAWELTRHPEAIDEEHRAALRKAGWKDREIWDIAAVAAFFNMSNRMSAATDKQPNDEYHSLAR